MSASMALVKNICRTSFFERERVNSAIPEIIVQIKAREGYFKMKKIIKVVPRVI